MIKKFVLLSFLVLSACRTAAQPVVATWPEFNCTDNEMILIFVDFRICTKAGAYNKVHILAGTIPSIAFEQNDSRFDVLSYESAASALAGLPKQIESSNAAQALDSMFSWSSQKHITTKQQTLLQVFAITDNTKLMVFKKGDTTAYVRLNTDAADNTIYITSADSENVYRLIGNFSEVDAKQWLSYLSPTVKP